MHLGFVELLLVFAVVLVLFGAKRVPELARSLGGAMREFKSGLAGEELKKPLPEKE